MTPTMKKARGATRACDLNHISLKGVNSMKNLTPEHDEAEYYDFNDEPTPSEVEWAALYLEHLPEHVELRFTKTAYEWTDQDGSRWRRAGHIIASPYSDGGRFKMVLYAGATMHDLNQLRHWVELARAGQFTRFGWESIPLVDGPDGYRFSASHRPDRHEYGPIVECSESACRETFHANADDQWHEADSIVKNGYSITLQRWEHEELWEVYLIATDCGLDVSGTAGLASDLQWMAAECRKLNSERQQALAHAVLERQVAA